MADHPSEPRYPMHNEAQARYSLLLLKMHRRRGIIDEARFQTALDRLTERWPALVHKTTPS